MKYIFIFNEGSISGSSRKQTTIALFTMKAKYMTLSNAIRELLSRIYIITELGISTIQPIVMYSDNQAAIAIARNEGDYRRAKHIGIRYHFIRNHLQNKTLELVYISSKQQLADFLIKPLSTKHHNERIHRLRLD